MKSKCICKHPKTVYKKYLFKNNRIGYKGTCATCGLLVGWYEGKNYKIVTSNNLRKGGDTRRQ